MTWIGAHLIKFNVIYVKINVAQYLQPDETAYPNLLGTTCFMLNLYIFYFSAVSQTYQIMFINFYNAFIRKEKERKAKHNKNLAIYNFFKENVVTLNIFYELIIQCVKDKTQITKFLNAHHLQYNIR